LVRSVQQGHQRGTHRPLQESAEQLRDQGGRKASQNGRQSLRLLVSDPLPQDAQSLPQAADQPDYMALAMRAMRPGQPTGDPPVGAALVIGDKVVGVARNRIVSARSFLAHAEN